MNEREDTFSGDNAHLVTCINALLDLDDEKALVPHGLGRGSHAYVMLAAASARLAKAALPERKELDGAGVTVEQCDREKAADIWRDYIAKVGECIVERSMRAGGLDEGLPSVLARHRLSATTPPEPEPVDGYRQAFYQLAELMGLGAQPVSPAEVWEGQMLPRLKAMFKTEPVDEPYPGLPMSDLDLTTHYEASKFDTVALVGSEVRQIIGELRHWRNIRAALTAQRGLTLAKDGVGERNSDRLAVRDLTISEVIAERARIVKLWDDMRSSDEELGGGSPGEWMIERLDEIDTAIRRLALAGGKTEGGA